MSIFKFKHFSVTQKDAAMKVGTDAMVLGALVNGKGKSRMLDVGAGTGVLSLMLAQENAKLIVEAIELDELSSAECAHNFVHSPWNDRMFSIQEDFRSYQTIELYDLIVSNPPYFQTRQKNEELRKAQARHEDALPMDAFFKKVDKLLTPEGECWIIIPSIDEESWLSQANHFSLFPKQKIRLIGKRGGSSVRTVFCFIKEEGEVLTRELVIRESNGKYSQDYIQLTKEFHGKSLG